jgi:DNA-binding CsgD family transcriptional regulator
MLYLKELLFIALLAGIILGNFADFIIDTRQGASFLHLFEEGVVILASGVMLGWLLRDLYRQRRELESLRREIAGARKPPARQAAEPFADRRRLADAIRQQFREWQLTRSEQEVGLLLLKGLSFKEIAALRDTHEKTVRAQASAIYRKAGVDGRHAFSAWFIEDFL